MAWTLFVFGCVMLWAALTANTTTFRGDLLQYVWCVTSVCIMIIAMYLRSIGW